LNHFHNIFTPTDEEIENIEIEWDGDEMYNLATFAYSLNN
jgi:hypothetical protein